MINYNEQKLFQAQSGPILKLNTLWESFILGSLNAKSLSNEVAFLKVLVCGFFRPGGNAGK